MKKNEETVSLKIISSYVGADEEYDTSLTASEFDNLTASELEALHSEALNELFGIQVYSNESNENIYEEEDGELKPEYKED